MEERYIASIDLGTSKLGLCVARVKGDDVQVVYYKETPSAGIRGSVVANPMKASLPLKKAIQEAEDELMIKILQVVVGMPRSDVRQETATGGIVRSNPDEYITEEEVENLKAMALESYPLDDETSQIMYGAVAQSFSIDDQIQLVESDVVGTLSKELEGNFKVFIGSRRATTAVDKIFNSMGIAIAKKYFLPDVVAKTVLTEEDRQSGVALVDIGAGVTSVAIYQGGIMRSYVAIPFGGKTITGDIRTECSISEDLAEKIKLKFGACMPGKLASLSEKVLQIRLTEPYKEVTVKYISEVIDARAREIINAVLYYIQESGLENNLRGGIVLTGGGASLVNFPEPVWADAPEAEEAVEEETEEVEEPFFVPDATFQQGEQGTLIPEEEYGPAEQPEARPEKPEKPKKVKKEKVKKEKDPNKPTMRWFKDLGSKVKTGVLNFYDEMTREEEEEPLKGGEIKKNEEE